MIVVYKNGVENSRIDEKDYPSINEAIIRVMGGAVGIVFRDTEGNLIN